LPIQDVSVEVEYQSGCDPLGSTVTGSNGGYVFAADSLPGPLHGVTFSKTGYHSRTHTVNVLETANLSIELDPLDTTDPKARIKSIKLERRKATVRFKGSDPAPSDGGLNFTCQLDDGEPSGCESPKRYAHLKKGKHKVRVVAYDAVGNFDETPAKASFKVG
jgi:hypothetical protein